VSAEGEAASRAELAKRSGLCAVYVCNIVALLRLHPFLVAIEGLQPGGTGNEVTERWLRPISRLPQAEQLVAVARRLDVGAPDVSFGAKPGPAIR
jgi:hypothetical protein